MPDLLRVNADGSLPMVLDADGRPQITEAAYAAVTRSPIADNVAAITEPSGTAETKINALLAALKACGLMTDDD